MTPDTLPMLTALSLAGAFVGLLIVAAGVFVVGE